MVGLLLSENEGNSESSRMVVLEGTFACMKQAYDLGINFFDTAER